MSYTYPLPFCLFLTSCHLNSTYWNHAWRLLATSDIQIKSLWNFVNEAWHRRGSAIYWMVFGHRGFHLRALGRGAISRGHNTTLLGIPVALTSHPTQQPGSLKTVLCWKSNSRRCHDPRLIVTALGWEGIIITFTLSQTFILHFARHCPKGTNAGLIH
jgi:hypothetical protein